MLELSTIRRGRDNLNISRVISLGKYDLMASGYELSRCMQDSVYPCVLLDF